MGMKHFGRTAVCALLLLWAAALLHWPGEAAQAARDGLSLCAGVIIPSLFPFFVLASLIVSLGLAEYLGRVLAPCMKPLFGVGGAGSSALAVGLIAGYPVGARTVRELYQRKLVDREEAELLLRFCNNCGPAFLLGAAGAGVFGSTRAGLLLLLCHWLGMFTVGILSGHFRPPQTADKPHIPSIQSVNLFQAFTDAVRSGLESTLNVCAYVVLFNVLLKLLQLSGVLALCTALLCRFGFSQSLAQALVTGLIELSNGISALSVGENLPARLAAASFILGFGGLSVQCQTLAVLDGSGLSSRHEVVGKLLHGLFSALWTGVILHFAPELVPASTLGRHTPALLWLPCAIAGGVWVAFVLLLLHLEKKETGKGGHKRV